MKARYVVGFAFNSFENAVVLIKKTHPEWQKGKLNGIGGHIEAGETPLEAMIREASEETGIETDFNWVHYASMQGGDFECFVFKGSTGDIPNRYSDSGEEVSWQSLPLECPRIANLDFLIEAALVSESYTHIFITYDLNGQSNQVKD
jgi:8-oxo-dGTP diphosphatase